MKDIQAFFKKEKIEYYSALSYGSLRETSPEIMKRENFTPRSVIIFLVPYYTGETINISRYAASLDYHLYLKGVCQRLISILSEKYPENYFKGYGDHSPIDERHAALAAGLGILGDNGLLINEKYGSYVFIADIVTDLPVDFLGIKSEVKTVSFCERCGICRLRCPTKILSGEGDMCLSAITQRKGELSESEKDLMRRMNTAWGCDECQRYCPHNRNPKKTPIDFFYEKRISELNSDILGEMSSEEFKLRAFAWRGRKTVERNLEILGI